MSYAFSLTLSGIASQNRFWNLPAVQFVLRNDIERYSYWVGLRLIVTLTVASSLLSFCMVVARKKSTTNVFNFVKVFWSSGRPLLCFSRFWPSENVARIRRVYFAYSQTKSVHTRNVASNTKGKCVFCFDCAKWSHYFIHRVALAARTKFHDVSRNEKRNLV